MAHAISVTRTAKSRLTEELRENSPFGTNYSDHMFVADYSKGEWRDARVVPYGPMSLSPALTALHYGQSLFEGFKAHRQPDCRVALFRPMANHARMNRSAARLAMPAIPESLFKEGLLELIRTDREWVPHREGGSLYVRPVYFGTDESLMVRPAESLSPGDLHRTGWPVFRATDSLAGRRNVRSGVSRRNRRCEDGR